MRPMRHGTERHTHDIASKGHATVFPAAIGFAALWAIGLLACPALSLAAAVATSTGNILLLAPVDADVAQRSAVRLVLDEVEKRTRVRWSVRFGADNLGHE